jgi:hypothetical protein
MATQKCIVCQTAGATRAPGADKGNDFARYDCQRCGAFVLSGTAEVVLEGALNEVPLRRSLMSHTIRRMQLPDNKHLRTITSEELPSFWKADRLPTPLEQADNLILWIGEHQDMPSVWAQVAPGVLAATIGLGLSPGGDSQPWGWLHKQLEPKGLYRLADRPGGQIGLMLTMAGWEKFEALKRAKVDSRTAFMALKFGEPDLDAAVANCFKPAVRRAGFELRVLTDQQAAGLIDDQIRAALLSARFVISDLTHGSYGAYWEAGFGEGRGIPVIYTCEKSVWDKTKTHFDTNHMTTILWSSDELKKAEDALAATIRATLRAEAIPTDN